MKHIPAELRPLIAEVQQLPFKAVCGQQLREILTRDALCHDCVEGVLHREAKPSFDLKIENLGDGGADTNQEISPQQALKEAQRLGGVNGHLSQDDYQTITAKLDDMGRYYFNLGLVGAQIRVKTGDVNIVDREEPMDGGRGDLPEGTAPFGGSMQMPQPESTIPGWQEHGNVYLDHNKPMRSEGAKKDDFELGFEEEADMGNNLSDLTVASVTAQVSNIEGRFAVSDEEMIRLLNEGIGKEQSQALRYRVYADTLAIAFRGPLVEEFRDHEKTERTHASILSRRVVVLGGSLDFKVESPTVFDPTDPDCLEKVLAELWAKEQSGLQYYLKLKEACGESVFRTTVESILEKELEHSDDIQRLGGLVY
jgi:bacterioferritin (cytochrome b1)